MDAEEIAKKFLKTHSEKEDSIKYILERKKQEPMQSQKQLDTSETQNKRVLEKLELITRSNQELEKQLEEKEKEIKRFMLMKNKEQLVVENEALKDTIAIVLAQKRTLYKSYDKLKQQLKSQPAEIVEKIRSEIYTRMVVECKETKYTNINLILDKILKEYQKEKENNGNK